jgi:serine/threonine protein phosphatase PrpC
VPLVFRKKIEEARLGRGEDRIASVRLNDRTMFIVVDGAGGMAGGARAADSICAAFEQEAHGTSDWVRWLRQRDRLMAGSGLPGYAAAVVVSILDDGFFVGASVGDCEAWLFGQGSPAELTRGQHFKPLLGDGSALPEGFAGRLIEGTLVMATDGLWKYATSSAEEIIQRHVVADVITFELVNSVRLKSGALPDDVGVVICWQEE